MKKYIVISVIWPSFLFILTNSIQAKESVEEQIQHLEDRPYYIEEPCDRGDSVESCRKIPYKHETVWFWLKGEKKAQRIAANNQRRDAWMKTNLTTQGSYTPPDKDPRHRMTLEAKIAALGNKPYRIEVECEHAQGSNCSRIPYKHETVWFWLDDKKKEARKKANNQRRNKWLRQSGLYPTSSEAPVKTAAKPRATLETAIEATKKKITTTQNQLEASQTQLKNLQDKKEPLQKRAKKLQGKIQALSNTLLTTEDGPQKLAKATQEVEGVIGKLRDLTGEITKVESDIRTHQSDLLAYQDQLEQEQDKLAVAAQASDQAAGRAPAAKAESDARLIEAERAWEFATKKIQEIKEQGKVAETALKSFGDLKKDLKIDGLEAQLLLNQINQKIQASVLGKYIKEHNEKTLEAALQGACQQAKDCAQNPSVDNSSIQNIFKKLKPHLEIDYKKDEKGKSK